MNQKVDTKVMLAVDAASIADGMVERRLGDEGFVIIGKLALDDDLAAHVAAGKPDILFVCARIPDKTLLSQLKEVSQRQLCPIVLHTQSDNADIIQAAVLAGVNTVAAGGARDAACHVLIDVACARFDEMAGLRRERDQAVSKLADRKLVEQAKGILMRERGLDENQTYRLMQKMAMDRGETLVGLAAKVMEASMLLK